MNYIDFTTLDSASYSTVPVGVVIQDTQLNVKNCTFQADTAQKILEDHMSSRLNDANSMPLTQDNMYNTPSEPDGWDLDYSIGDLAVIDSLARLESDVQLPNPTYPCTPSILEESVTTTHTSYSPLNLPGLAMGCDISLLEIALSGSLFNDCQVVESGLGSSCASHYNDPGSSRPSSPSSFVTDIIFSEFGPSRFTSPDTTSANTESSDGFSSAADECGADLTHGISGPAALTQRPSHDFRSSDSSPGCSRVTTPRSERFKKGRIESHSAGLKASRRSRAACALCRRTFSREADRDRHLATVHKDPAGPHHPCRFCGKSFSRSDAKARHEFMNSPRVITRSVECRVRRKGNPKRKD
ncbi:hypothetical protein PQX77_002003 [Marasmius sp. AFHP31]|nr:hypothetical protein PQX77_002003 [Marasmius sp. AFHP31]